MTDSTGPNTSSRAIRIGLLTLRRWSAPRTILRRWVRGFCRQAGLGALLAGDVDIAQHPLILRTGRDRPHLGLELHRITHACRCCELNKPLRKVFFDRSLHEQPRAGDAGLSRRSKDPGNHTFYRVVDLGIVEYDVRRLTAEFERHALEVFRRGFIDLAPTDFAAGEGDLATSGCATSGSPTSAETGDVLTTPSGKPASSNSRTSSRIDAEANSDGLITTVLPAASAGASFHDNSRTASSTA